ncbi:MAG: DMT family transporter [Janthinobacterium lividum]
MAWFAFLVAIVAGAANPFQSATNGQLNKQLQQPVWAGIAIYIIGLLGMLAVQAFTRQPMPTGNVGQVSWWAWTGGLISILSTMAGLTLVQRLGAGIFTSLSLTASLVVSVLLDQFGVLGLKQHPASIGRMIGCGLLVAGVWLVSRS